MSLRKTDDGNVFKNDQKIGMIKIKVMFHECQSYEYLYCGLTADNLIGYQPGKMQKKYDRHLMSLTKVQAKLKSPN